jgi:hypothetical protein
MSYHYTYTKPSRILRENGRTAEQSRELVLILCVRRESPTLLHTR